MICSIKKLGYTPGAYSLACWPKQEPSRPKREHKARGPLIAHGFTTPLDFPSVSSDYGLPQVARCAIIVPTCSRTDPYMAASLDC